MNVSFTPAASVLGVLPGGWLTVALSLIVAFAVSRFLARRSLSAASANLLFAILASLVFYTGFTWTADSWMTVVELICRVAIAIAIVLFVVDRFRGTADKTWSIARAAGKVAVVSSILLASNLSFSGWNLSFGDNGFDKQTQQSIKDLRLEFATQLNAAKVDASSFETECKSIPNVCAVITAHTSDIKGLKAEDAKIWDALNALKSKADTTVALPKTTNVNDAADSLATSLAPMGWTKGGIVTGNKINYSKNRYDAGRQAFVQQTINTPAKYAAHLSGTSASDQAAKALVLENTPDELHATFLRGASVIPVQFTKDSCVNGNTGWDGHNVVRFDKICHEAGDIWWVPVGPDGTAYWAAAVRADCGNPSMYVAPFPRNKPAPSVCPQGSDRAGMPINKGCYDKPKSPKPTSSKTPTSTHTSTPKSTPTPSKTSMPTPTSTPKSPKPTPSKTPTPSETSTPTPSQTLDAKDPSKDPVNNGNAGNGGGKNQDPGPGPVTTPTQPPSTPRTNPTTPTSTPTATQLPAPAPEPSAPQPTNAPTVCSPAPGRTCP